MFLDILVHVHEYIQYIGDTWRVFHCIWQRYPLGLNDELIRIWSSNICRTMFRIFYESVVASASLYSAVCWGCRRELVDSKRQ